MSQARPRDLGVMYGMSQAVGAATPLFLASELGWNITTATDRFPRAVAFLLSLGWTNAEILQRTYAAMAYNDAVMYGPQVLFPHECHDISVIIPPGEWYYNMELRSGQHRNIGDTSRFNFGTGGTQWTLEETNWKSIYGAGQAGTYLGIVPWNYTGEDNLATFPVALPGGFEWCHHFTVEDMRFNGAAPDGFNVAAKRQAAVMYYSPGECSGIFRCEFDDFNDFGVLVSHNPAYTNIRDCSFFRNKVAGIGSRGGALAFNSFQNISGDFNGLHYAQFRGGSDAFGTGSFWPHAIASNPGGMVIWNGFKLEDSCGRTGYPTYSGTSTSIGKGNMLARLTGLFYVHINGGTAATYIGKANALVETIDDFDEGWGGIPYNNSFVELNNVYTNRFANYVHDWKGEKVFEANELSTFNKPLNCRWAALENSGLAYDHKTGISTPQASALFHGTQPFINDGQAVAWGRNSAPLFGYNAITGVNYP